MKRRIDAEELGDAIEPVLRLGDDLLIEKDGKVVAAVITAVQYEVLEQARIEAGRRLDEFVRENWAHNADVPLEEIEQIVAEVVKDVRKRGSRPQRSENCARHQCRCERNGLT